MANYLVNYSKKQRILRHREDELRRLIARGQSEETLLVAAEVVRLARIRALRAKQAKISPADIPELREEAARLDEMIAAITAISASDVLAEFTSTT
jgi:hypothetical protein